MSVRVIEGDCRDVLATLPEQSVHCIVTSPPYFGLRDYGVAGQIGLESTPDAFVAELVAVFRECKRVLRDDGTLFLNLGDSYCSTDKWGGGGNAGKHTVDTDGIVPSWAVRRRRSSIEGIKPKDLIGIPWLVAFALRADGWYLRSDIIWAKPNPMPESVRDRPTKAHEYLFLLSKRDRYFYDVDAIKEPPTDALLKQVADGYEGSDTKDYQAGGAQSASGTKARIIEGARKKIDKQRGHGRRHAGFNERWDALSRDEQMALGSNKRSVWTVATQPFSDWGEIVRQVRVEPDADVDGKKRKASPDCPVHGDRRRSASTARDGGHEADPTCHNEHTGSHRALAPRIGSEPTETIRAPETAQRNSDLLSRSCSASAIPHSSESRRTDLDPETSPACSVSAQTLIHIPDTSGERDPSGSADHTLASKSVADARADNPASQKADRNARTSTEQASFSASHGSDCTCEWYIEITEKTSHFATFPPDLIEPCIKAGTSENGCCAKCGAPWVREVERGDAHGRRDAGGVIGRADAGMYSGRAGARASQTLGWSPSCSCDAGVVPCTVLDPFFGAGTTGLVADRLQRNCIGIELNPAYAEMARKRLTKDAGLFAEVA